MEEKSKQTQHDKIIQYLKENGCASIRELFIYCNINSPSKRLSELRKMGMIYSENRERVNASGEKKRFKVYFLTEKGKAA